MVYFYLPVFSIVSKHTFIIKLFSLNIGYKQNQDAEVNWNIFISKEGKRGLAECEIILIFRAKHENEVEAQPASNCLPSKNVNLCLLDSVESIVQGIKIL